MMSYLTVAAATLALAGGGFGYIQNQKNKTLLLDIASAQAKLLTCGLRLNNLVEDVRDDNEINDLTDDDLRNVPDDWLFKPAATGGN